MIFPLHKQIVAIRWALKRIESAEQRTPNSLSIRNIEDLHTYLDVITTEDAGLIRIIEKIEKKD